MKEELFSELVEVGRKGEPFFAAQKQPARMAVFEAPDMAAIRGDYGLSQTKVAALLGISVRTLQNWEQGRRCPRRTRESASQSGLS